MTRETLASLVSVVGGGTPRRTEPAFYGGGVPWVTPKDMKSSCISGSKVTLTAEGVAASAAKMIPSGSVLVVVRSGVLKHSLPVALTQVPVTVNQDMKALIPGPRLDAGYLAHLLSARSPEILGWVRATTADNFPIGKLLGMELELPPIEEQRRIVATLDRAQGLIERAARAERAVRALPQQLFARRFAGCETAPTLGEHLEFLTSGSRGWAKHYADQGDTFIRIQNVQDARLDLSDVAFVNAPESAEARRTRVATGDVLLSITADLGRTAVVPKDLDAAYVNQHLAILRLKGIDPYFVAHYLRSPGGSRQLMRRNRAAVKAGLNFDDIRSVELPLVPLAQQRSFSQQVRALESHLRVVELQRAELARLFASLQARAFSGRL